jgi:signal transduction histidine kinase
MPSLWKPSVTSSPQPLAERTGLLVLYGLAALLLVIWAVTGGGYFWPMWAWFGMAFPLTLVAAARWSLRHPQQHRSGRFTQTAAALLSVIVAGDVLIWLLSGLGYFWPMWPAMVLVVVLVVHRLVSRPRDQQLEQRVDELTRTRAGAVDVQAAELRRIERDLHDGAQSRLVALSMQIGRAEERLASKGAEAGDLELLKLARAEATAAITELRDLARGISPPVLADRGLPAAVGSLAERSGSNVTVHAGLDQRLPPAVENAAYFVVAESLTNALKHAPGAPVQVAISHAADELSIVVSDRGPGGADPDGSGISGLRKRVEALDGTLSVMSPSGHGTTISATLPCE